ncbi:MAG: endonuclease/exonuclease/phosphatase family protein [Planctomycetota bacterium]|jgi:exonuclease III
MNYKIMSYNIERMQDFFKKNSLRSEYKEKAEAVAQTILSAAPHILGIIEGSDKAGDHEYFINNTAISELGYKLCKSKEKRGKQDLLFYYRDPFEVVSLDENVSFYNRWVEDIDNDTIEEVLRFERRPLEVFFRDKESSTEFMVILLSFKSKGVFSVTDIHSYEHIALANRKKLHAQSMKVRERIDNLLDRDPDMPLIVMGDLNDEPGMDYFQKQVGASAVETITGSIYNPEKILHNTMWHMTEGDKKKNLWTTEYPDPIVANLKKHKAWLDHIFVSPGMLKRTSDIKYIKDSGCIAEKNETSAKASDHYPVCCDIEFS